MKARWFFTCTVIFLIMTPLSSHCDVGSVALQKLLVRGAVTHVITANLNDPDIKIKVGLPARGIPTSEPFLSMVKRHSPIAAVTGTYFDTRTLFPVGSIVIDGVPAYQSAIGTSVCFFRSEGVTCSSRSHANGYRVTFRQTRKGERFDWTGVRQGIRTGPLLLSGGHYALNPGREGFRHPGLFGSRTRMAMGVTAHNKLLLVSVSTPVTFGRLASIMKHLGALDAVCLDGGTSSAMYYRGRVVRRPGRRLTNIIEIYNEARPEAIPSEQPMIEIAKAQPIAPAVSLVNAALWKPQRPAYNDFIYRPSTDVPIRPVARDLNEIAGPSSLSLTKGRSTLFPVDRAQLPRLKGCDDSEHFVHIAANAKIMHHLIS